MAIPQRIRDYLDSRSIPYETLRHSEAYTAHEIAHSLHISGRKCAKTVVARGDGKPVIVVLPASHRLSFQELKLALKVNHLELLLESELPPLFPDCDLGAVPPFGSLYGIDVWVDRVVASAETVLFCAGTHEDCIRMRYSDFAKLTRPFVGHVSEVESAAAA